VTDLWGILLARKKQEQVVEQGERRPAADFRFANIDSGHLEQGREGKEVEGKAAGEEKAISETL